MQHWWAQETYLKCKKILIIPNFWLVVFILCLIDVLTYCEQKDICFIPTGGAAPDIKFSTQQFQSHASRGAW